MILVKPSFEILAVMDCSNPILLIELAGRTCYKTEDKITHDSAEKFVKMIKDRGHHSVLEHSALTVRFICDRGVTHELVRHRLCAYSQESTRYCNYKGGVTFVIPPWINVNPGKYSGGEFYKKGLSRAELNWLDVMFNSEDYYIELLNDEWSPQQARSVLPNSLKTEIVVTANFREWNHIFTLRCSKAAHPQMREIMIPLRNRCRKLIPVVFEDAN